MVIHVFITLLLYSKTSKTVKKKLKHKSSNYFVNVLRLKSLQDILSNFKIFELFEKKSTKQKSSEEQIKGTFVLSLITR